MRRALLLLALIAVIAASLGCQGIWTDKAQLKAIIVDGREIKGFRPYVYEYTYVVASDYKGIPTVIGIPDQADYTVSYSYPEELPNVIKISVTPGSQSGTRLKETFYRVNVLFAKNGE